MTQQFNFGFHNDDIEVEGNEENDVEMEEGIAVSGEEASIVETQSHTLEEMLASLPSHLTYTTHILPTSLPTSLPRRDLFDIRAQLMAEDTLLPLSPSSTFLTADDIVPQIYEGGFKTWECAVDLAVYLNGLITKEGGLGSEGGKHVRVIELGAGTALPTTLLLSHLLSPNKPNTSAASSRAPSSNTYHLTLTDYNPLVLTHASIPNLLLTHLSLHPSIHFPSTSTLPIPSPLITSFTTTLATNRIHIDAISGPWGPKFIDLITSPNTNPKTPAPVLANPDYHSTPPMDISTTNQPQSSKLPLSHTSTPTSNKPSTSTSTSTTTLILASETIYAPSSLRPFTSNLLDILTSSPNPNPSPNPSTSSNSARAFIAAKKVYFGVGGGIDEFLVVLREMGGWGRVVWESDGDGGGGGGGRGGGGVGRCILEVGVVGEGEGGIGD